MLHAHAHARTRTRTHAHARTHTHARTHLRAQKRARMKRTHSHAYVHARTDTRLRARADARTRRRTHARTHARPSPPPQHTHTRAAELGLPRRRRWGGGFAAARRLKAGPVPAVPRRHGGRTAANSVYAAQTKGLRASHRRWGTGLRCAAKGGPRGTNRLGPTESFEWPACRQRPTRPCGACVRARARRARVCNECLPAPSPPSPPSLKEPPLKRTSVTSRLVVQTSELFPSLSPPPPPNSPSPSLSLSLACAQAHAQANGSGRTPGRWCRHRPRNRLSFDQASRRGRTEKISNYSREPKNKKAPRITTTPKTQRRGGAQFLHRFASFQDTGRRLGRRLRVIPADRPPPLPTPHRWLGSSIWLGSRIFA